MHWTIGMVISCALLIKGFILVYKFQIVEDKNLEDDPEIIKLIKGEHWEAKNILDEAFKKSRGNPLTIGEICTESTTEENTNQSARKQKKEYNRKQQKVLSYILYLQFEYVYRTERDGTLVVWPAKYS